MKDCDSSKDTLFFLEGETEILSFRQHLGIRARKLGIHGHNPTMDQIVKKVAVSVYTDEPKRVFIMFDRESRDRTSQELKVELEGILQKKFPDVEFLVAIPDRDFESWIFSDLDSCSKYFGKRLGRAAKFEGEVGARKLRSLIGPGHYEKPDDGVALFGYVKWSIVESKSASARSSDISSFFKDCRFLAS